MNWRNLRVASTGLGFLALAALAQATIDYQVTFHDHDSTINVDMTIPARGPISVQVPNWMPGLYMYGGYYKGISDLSAIDSSGQTLTVNHPDDNTWSLDPKDSSQVKISYKVNDSGRVLFASPPNAGYVQLCGAATYLYVVDRKTEDCTVSFHAPTGWPIAVGLDPSPGNPDSYVAPGYDVLADNPVSTGPDIWVDHYTVRGIDHTVVIEGDLKKKLNRKELLSDCQFVSAAETDFFGGAPYHKYVWHFSVVQDGGAGLEHLSSTQIWLPLSLDPGTQNMLSHEYFHLWNVKRIRPKILGPFDYLKLPKTGFLWWLEGVTDYYADLIPYRYGEWDRPQFLSSVIDNMDPVRTNPARFRVSPYDSSYDVDKAAGGMGNSDGYQISYYNLGWLCGMCLDIEIRADSGGVHSLDDVMRALYNKCKDDQPGFDDDAIRELCVQFGGPSLGPFYDRIIMKPGELPIEGELAKVGLKIGHNGGVKEVVDDPKASKDASALLAGWLATKHLPQ